jgi:hypothetical protein
MFRVAYSAVDAKLPRGRRIVLENDPLLHVPVMQANNVGLANRQFAGDVGLAAATLDEAMSCKPFNCAFEGGVVASVSLWLTSKERDSAVVNVATRYVVAASGARRERGFNRLAVAVYQVTLVRIGAMWRVASVTPRSES